MWGAGESNPARFRARQTPSPLHCAILPAPSSCSLSSIPQRSEMGVGEIKSARHPGRPYKVGDTLVLGCALSTVQRGQGRKHLASSWLAGGDAGPYPVPSGTCSRRCVRRWGACPGTLGRGPRTDLEMGESQLLASSPALPPAFSQGGPGAELLPTALWLPGTALPAARANEWPAESTLISKRSAPRCQQEQGPYRQLPPGVRDARQELVPGRASVRALARWTGYLSGQALSLASSSPGGFSCVSCAEAQRAVWTQGCLLPEGPSGLGH